MDNTDIDNIDSPHHPEFTPRGHWGRSIAEAIGGGLVLAAVAAVVQNAPDDLDGWPLVAIIGGLAALLMLGLDILDRARGRGAS